MSQSQDEAASQEVADAYNEAEDLHADLGLQADGHEFDSDVQLVAAADDLSELLADFDLESTPAPQLKNKPTAAAASSSSGSKRAAVAGVSFSGKRAPGRPSKTAAEKIRERINQTISHNIRMVQIIMSVYANISMFVLTSYACMYI